MWESFRNPRKSYLQYPIKRNTGFSLALSGSVYAYHQAWNGRLISHVTAAEGRWKAMKCSPIGCQTCYWLYNANVVEERELNRKESRVCGNWPSALPCIISMKWIGKWIATNNLLKGLHGGRVMTLGREWITICWYFWMLDLNCTKNAEHYKIVNLRYFGFCPWRRIYQFIDCKKSMRRSNCVRHCTTKKLWS